MVPNKERKCGDTLCCLVFFVFWLGMAIVGIVGVTYGQPASLLFATDFSGDVCGVNNNGCTAPCGGKDLSKQTSVVYPRTTQDLSEQMAAGLKIPGDFAKLRFYGVCVDKCPTYKQWTCDAVGDAWVATKKWTANKVAKLDACEVEVKKSLAGTEFAGGLILAQMAGRTRLGGSSECGDVLQHCWKNYADQIEIFFRCMPIYEVSTNFNATCVEPPTVAASDPRCAVKTTTTTTEVCIIYTAQPTLTGLPCNGGTRLCHSRSPMPLLPRTQLRRSLHVGRRPHQDRKTLCTSSLTDSCRS